MPGLVIREQGSWMTRSEEPLQAIWRSSRVEHKAVRKSTSNEHTTESSIHTLRESLGHFCIRDYAEYVCSRSLDLLKGHFQTDILEGQDPWVDNEKAERLLKLLPDKALNDALRKKWDSAPGRSSASKWADIDRLASTGVSKTLDSRALKEAKQDIVLEYTYPRLDVEVSKKLNHLLKSPFVIHPGTGRVCVPIDLRRLERFDPLGVPTVTELLGEIDTWDSASKKPEREDESEKMPDYEKTSMKPYVEYFKTHIAGILKEEKGVKREREEGDPMEF